MSFPCQALASVRRAIPSLRRLRRKDDWAIGIYTGSDPLRVRGTRARGNPVLTAASVRDVPALFVADPFLVRGGDRWHLFFEVLNAATRRGQIGLASSHDTRSWEYQQIVLDEPFHLSYPHVFAWDGAYYMTPETMSQRQVRLYRATAYPLEWQHVATLLDGDDFIDPTPFAHAGRWWMFVGTNAQHNDTLRLYHADTPLGPWSEHPCSPVVSGDARTARPGGRVLAYDGRLVRFAQDDTAGYGRGVYAFEITELTASSYAERPLGRGSVLRASGFGWNARGMHTIDPHRADDGTWIACVDGYRKRLYVRQQL